MRLYDPFYCSISIFRVAHTAHLLEQVSAFARPRRKIRPIRFMVMPFIRHHDAYFQVLVLLCRFRWLCCLCACASIVAFRLLKEKVALLYVPPNHTMPSHWFSRVLRVNGNRRTRFRLWRSPLSHSVTRGKPLRGNRGIFRVEKAFS